LFGMKRKASSFFSRFFYDWRSAVGSVRQGGGVISEDSHFPAASSPFAQSRDISEAKTTTLKMSPNVSGNFSRGLLYCQMGNTMHL